jgi:hypothetical protein
MILNDVVAEVRNIIQDSDSNAYRYTDAMLLKFANQTLKRTAIFRPDLFALQATLTCADGTVVQSAPSDSIRLMEVYYNTNGNGIIETTREVLDQAYPAWMTDSAANTINWIRNIRNPNKFFIYPKAPTSHQIEIEYAQTPPDYLGTATVALLPDAYFPAIIDGPVFLAESIDNEHVNSNRAALFQQSFSQALGISSQTRQITDTEGGGISEEEVV